MASRASNFCIDAHDPYAQTQWWAKVLEDFVPEDGWEMKPGDEECGLQGPGERYLLFLKVPEAKTVKNRMHMCLRPTDRHRDEEVERIIAEEGWTKPSMTKMRKLDSFMKESQRYTGIGMREYPFIYSFKFLLLVMYVFRFPTLTHIPCGQSR